jgi:hypothetical protein
MRTPAKIIDTEFGDEFKEKEKVMKALKKKLEELKKQRLSTVIMTET